MANNLHRSAGSRLTDRYCITGELGRGAMGEVHRAFPFEDPSSEVAIKIIQRNRKLGPSDLLRFQKEAALMSQLHHQNIISFLELGLFEGEGEDGVSSGYYIVMEYARGYNLRTSLERDGRKDLPFFFQVGLQVAEALDYTHGKNIIHRDIKPHNIIVTEASRDDRGVLVKVLDFGVARLAEAIHHSKDMDANQALEDQAGTPLYMAPEISAAGFGRVDHRVDLYSLGCVMYEVLTGHPPFHGSSRDALERAHQNEDPQPLINLRPDVPLGIAMIVHKLLAKRPDDRYQTAFALQADLVRAKMLYDEHQRRMPTFSLGLNDRLFAVSAQLPMVGRQQDLKTLIDEYEKVNVASGRSRMTVISGQSGIGKTRLLSEVKTTLLTRRIRFVQGIFTKHENTLPFNALANAFNETLMRTLKSNSGDADELSRKIKTIVGPDAHLVATIVPGLRPYIGDLSNQDVPQKLDDNNFMRFAKAFSDFVRCLAPENQPLVFIFDDLHWADDRSLELIDQFFSNANSLKYHLALSYQNDSPRLSQRFMAFISKFRQLKRRYTEIELKPLNSTDASDLIGVVLHQVDAVPAEFSEYIVKRSDGVPMRVVELVRRLVSQDVIRIDAKRQGWDFDVKALKTTTLRLHAIDIVLAKIGDYKDIDLRVLQSAAVAGHVFYFEMLLLEGKVQSPRVALVLEHAIEDGIIVRCLVDSQLAHLGKSYMFSHQKVREGVYDLMSPELRREIHRDLAFSLMNMMVEPKGAQIFALAHHLNVCTINTGDDYELDAKRLKLSLLAGDEARRTNSPQAAEKYYDVALEIINAWPNKLRRPELKVNVVEKLADVNASQKKYALALARYADLLGMSMPTDRRSAIAARMIGFQMVGGLISDAIKLMGQVLKGLGRRPPSADILTLAKCWFWFMWDVCDVRKNSRIFSGMKLVYKRSKALGEKAERYFPAAQIYQLASVVYGRNDRRLSFVAQDLALSEVIHGRASFSTAVKAVADRAALLAYFGAVSMSYRLFDICAEAARRGRIERALGYTLLRRAESVDYIKGRHEDVSDHLRQAWSWLSPQEDRLAFARAVTFRQYRELVRCNFGGVVSLGALMPDTVQTRNWNTSVSMALTLYSFLLQGSRNKIVEEGTRFIQRRDSVSARMDDLFSQVVVAMLTFARGETDPARQAFDRVVRLWMGKSQVKESLTAWQEDFVGLFVSTYPVLFEQEYGRQLMRQSEMNALLRTMKSQGLSLFAPKRTVQFLVTARTRELLGERQKVSQAYDKALRSAKESGNNLVQTLCYMWFGMYLVDQGHSHKKEYLRRAYSHAQKYHIEGFAAWIRKSAEKRKINFREGLNTTSAKPGFTSASIGLSIPALAQETLSIVAKGLEQDTRNKDLFEAIMGLLGKHHPGRSILFLSNKNEQLGCLYPTIPPHDLSRIYESVSMYFNLRSTLTMHLYHANWLHDPSTASRTSTGLRESDGFVESHKTNGQVAATFQADATAAVDIIVSESMIGNTQAYSSMPSVRASHQGGRDVSGMFALVPVRFSGETIGVVLIEELNALTSVDLNATRRDLDLFGAHLGAYLGSMMPSSELLSKPKLEVVQHSHRHGGLVLEDCSWLRMQFTGQMRTGREASWYMGLQWGDGQYVVAYCCIRGAPSERDQFSAEVFRQVLAVRELASMSGRARFEISDLRSELGGLFTRSGLASKMDEVLFAVSIFNRESPEVESGHFGSARPIIVGSDNKVEAFNQVPVQLRDGRDVRYWEIQASLSDDGIYLLSFDTGKLKAHVEDGMMTHRKSVNGSTMQDAATWTRKYLDSALAKSELPRYYLAVTRKRDAASVDIDQQKKPA